MTDFLHCLSCGKCVSTGFTPVPTDTPDKGLIVRANIECPECIGKHDLTRELLDLITLMPDTQIQEIVDHIMELREIRKRRDK